MKNKYSPSISKKPRINDKIVENNCKIFSNVIKFQKVFAGILEFF